MTRASKFVIVILAALVVIGAYELPNLRRAVERLSGNPATEEQARREMLQAPISTPTDVNVKAQLYWLAPGSQTLLQAETIELPLSADPTERSKQLLQALIIKAPSAERRTLPADATLLAFYLDPEGTAIADFSDELSQKTPSGILSEQLVVDSITQTLGANVQSIQRLKILIHGQEADTLAGHVDLSALFAVPHAPPETEPNLGSAPTQSTPAQLAAGDQKSIPNAQPATAAGNPGTQPTASGAKPPAPPAPAAKPPAEAPAATPAPATPPSSPAAPPSSSEAPSPSATTGNSAAQ